MQVHGVPFAYSKIILELAYLVIMFDKLETN